MIKYQAAFNIIFILSALNTAQKQAVWLPVDTSSSALDKKEIRYSPHKIRL